MITIKDFFECEYYKSCRNTSKKPLLLLDQDEEFECLIEPDHLDIWLLGVAIFRGVFMIFDPDEDEYRINNICYHFFDIRTGCEIFFDTGASLQECLDHFVKSKGLFRSYPDYYEIAPCCYTEDGGRFLIEKVAPHGGYANLTGEVRDL